MPPRQKIQGMGTQWGGRGSRSGSQSLAGGAGLEERGLQGCPVLCPLPRIWAEAQSGPLTIPHSHPQFPLWEDEAGRFHSFLEGSGG